MRRYVGVRLLQLLPVLLIASVVIWGMIFIVPGDPVAIKLGPDATPAQLEAARAELGLDRPIPVQYLDWLTDVAVGNLGNSYVNDLPVADLIAKRIPATLHLVIATAVLSLLVSFPIALIGVASKNRFIKGSVSAYISLALAVPSFLIGIILILVFGVQLGVLPTTGYVPIWEDPAESLRHLILPVITMSIFFSGLLARFLKASLLAEMNEDYVRTARSKGVGEGTIWRTHILRNGLLPVVTVFGLYVGTLIAGAVITESIFTFPGLGRLLLDSVSQRDYPVIQGTILLVIVAFVVVNLLVDLLYAALDPRIRYAK